VARLQAELASLKDASLRRQAEIDNYRKRMIKHQEDNKRFAIRDMAVDIIGINDDLLAPSAPVPPCRPRGADASPGIAQKESHDIKSLEAVLKKNGRFEIEALDREFEPKFSRGHRDRIQHKVEGIWYKGSPEGIA
jgi:molecular chaperone GrpE